MLNKNTLQSFWRFSRYIISIGEMKLKVFLVFFLNTLSYLFYVLLGDALMEQIVEQIEPSMNLGVSIIELFKNYLFNTEISFHWLILWVLCLCIAEIANASAQYLSGRIYSDTEYHTRMSLVRYVYSCSTESINKCPGEALLENYTDLLAEAIRELIEKVSHDILPSVVFIVSTIIYISVRISGFIGTLLSVIIIFFGVFRYIKMKSVIVYVKSISKFSSERTRAIVEAFQNIASTQSFEGSDYAVDYVNHEHLKETENYRTYTEKAALHTFQADFINNVCRFVVLTGLIFGNLLALDNDSTVVGTILRCSNLTSWIMYTTSEKSKDLVDTVQSFGQATKSLEFFLNLDMDETIETTKPNGYAIELKNLTWSYRNSNNEELKILSDLSLKIDKGDIVAITGKSGIGKSTTLNILTKRLSCNEGQVFIGGKDICQLTSHQTREIFSYLDQIDHLFDDTIKNNITLGRQHTDMEYAQAIKISGLQPLIDKKGDEFVVGKRGTRISGGERRRVSIARALLKKSNVLILDEMNTGIDPITYVNIFHDILDYVRQNNITLIIIDHYNTLNEYCDNIVFLQQGKNPTIGNHESLMESCEEYRDYFNIVKNFKIDVSRQKNETKLNSPKEIEQEVILESSEINDNENEHMKSNEVNNDEDKK
jgi:ABC-type multidrug transport system fused ATPase/permease subunit